MRLLVILLAAYASAATAADDEGNYAVWGSGAKSCHTYNVARQQGEAEAFRSFIMGYLTAYDALSADTYSISGRMTLDEILLWIDTYCEQKPVHAFDQALADFTTEHIATRTQRKPGQYGR